MNRTDLAVKLRARQHYCTSRGYQCDQTPMAMLTREIVDYVPDDMIINAYAAHPIHGTALFTAEEVENAIHGSASVDDFVAFLNSRLGHMGYELN